METQSNGSTGENAFMEKVENDQTRKTSDDDGDITSADGNPAADVNVMTNNGTRNYIDPENQKNDENDKLEASAEKFEREAPEKSESNVHVHAEHMNGTLELSSHSEDGSEKAKDINIDSDYCQTDDVKLSNNSHELLQNVDLELLSSDENDQERLSVEIDASSNEKKEFIDDVEPLQSPTIQVNVDEKSVDLEDAHISPEVDQQGETQTDDLSLDELSDKSPRLDSIHTDSSEALENRMDNLTVTSDDDSLEKVTPIENSKWQFTENCAGDMISTNDIKDEVNEEVSLKQLIDNFEEVKSESEEKPCDIPVDVTVGENQRDESTSVMSNLTDYSDHNINDLRSTDNEQPNPNASSQSSDNLSAKYPDYPENYNGYKVCRDVAPGVKECLILETGETASENCSPKALSNSPATNDPILSNHLSPRDEHIQSSHLSSNNVDSPTNEISSLPAKNTFKIKKPLNSELDVHKNLELVNGEEEITMRQSEHDNEQSTLVNTVLNSNKIHDTNFKLESTDQIPSFLDENKYRLPNDDVNKKFDVREQNIPRRNLADSSSDSEPLYHSNNYHSYKQQEYYPSHSLLHSHTTTTVNPNVTEYTDLPRHMTHGNSKYSGGVYVTQPYGMSSIPSHMENNSHRETRKMSPRAAVSSPSTGPVPGYNSLQEQQTSWLQMFRDLEEQHNKELKWQYKQHRLTIDRIQDQLEHDLKHQQKLFSNRLDQHKETLENTKNSYGHLGHGDFPSYLNSYGTKSYDHSEDYAEDELTDADDRDRLRKHHKKSPRGDRSAGRDGHSSQVDYIPSAKDILKSGSNLSSVALPVKRSLEQEFSSPYSSPEPESRAYRYRELVDDEVQSRDVFHNVSREELPRAGVYSCPMPNVAYRNHTKVSDHSSVPSNLYNHQPEVLTPPRSAVKRTREFHDEQIGSQSPFSRNLHPSSIFDDVSLSPNTKMNLREKHSKHLADLRAYYEEELQDLRTALNSSDQSRMQADHAFLHTDNNRLKKKSKELENQLDDALVEIKDLQQKLLGLESRSGDYACMYRDSQGMVVELEKRIDELEEYCQEKDVRIKELESRFKQQTLALQENKKMLENREENSRRDQATMKRLVEKYEGLEKEYKLLQNTATATEEKLFETRNEIIEINRTISKVELENKRLNRENDCLRARIKQSISLTLPNGYHTESASSAADHQDRQNFDARFYPREEVDGASEELLDGDGYTTSPLLMAERELMKIRQKIQHSQPQVDPPVPKLQKKFYGSDMSIESKNNNIIQNNSTASSLQNTPTKSRLRDKNLKKSPLVRRKSKSPKAVQKLRDKSNSPLPSTKKVGAASPVTAESSSPMRFDIPWDNIPNNERTVTKTGQVSCPISIQNHRDSTSSKSAQGHDRVGANVQSMLDKVKAGEYISRPEWEDVYTSMAKPKKSAVTPQRKQENKIQDRLKSISELEKHYDDLQAEKRNLESLLTKIPVTGRVDRKKKKVPTATLR